MNKSQPMVGIGVNLGGIPKLSNGMHVLEGGTQIYTRNGEKHRDNGPAEIRRTGYQAYFHNGVLDRNDGPAVIHPNGTQEYWRKGKHIQTIVGEVQKIVTPARRPQRRTH